MWLHFPSLLLATLLRFEVYEEQYTWERKIGDKNQRTSD
jgi:hypothetical protein